MSELRENLIDRMIYLYGFEDDIVISFAHLCEQCATSTSWDAMLQFLVQSHEQFPIIVDMLDD